MCYTPIYLKSENIKSKYRTNSFPCGKCLECRKSRVNSWFVRLKSEMSYCVSAHFVTLTYDDRNVPFSEFGYNSLDYKDTQKYWKRVRKAMPNGSKKIKYFLVGEYGSKTYRPHYHAIVFNGIESLLRDSWTLGMSHIGNVTDASLYYTLKYCFKNVIDDQDDDDDRVKSKALMSKNLGLSYLTDDVIKYYHDDVSRPMRLLGNRIVGLPRYYRDKIFDDGQKDLRSALLSDFSSLDFDRRLLPHFGDFVKMQLELKERDLLINSKF